MIFGKIDYINLLPLHIYLKGSRLKSYEKKTMEYKKAVPSTLNKALYNKKIEAAIISSIESKRKKYKKLPLGICAFKKVDSVFVIKNTKAKQDPHSASSNALARLLGLKAQVIIGDKALKAYLQDKSLYIDLCTLWYEKTSLPFVFGRFSCIKNYKAYKKILSPFLRQKIFIPQYLLQDYAKSRQIPAKEILKYLKLIYYKIGKKESLALKRFFSLSKLG